jgi:predicted transcriptional regulator
MAKEGTKGATSFRLSAEAKRLLGTLAEYLGISQASVLEQAVRQLARREGLPVEIGVKGTGLASQERALWEELVTIGQRAAEEDPTPLPADLAAQHDHYAYGTPKR